MKGFKDFRNFLHLVLCLYIGLMGLYIVLTLTFVRFRIHPNLPVDLISFSRTLSLIIGLFLIYFSWQLFHRQRRAFYLSILSFVILIIFGLMRIHPHFVSLFFYIIALVFLLINQKNYTVKSDNLSLGRGILISFIIDIIAFIYATLGFYFLEHRDIGLELNFQQSMIAAARELFTFQNHIFTPHTRHAAWFLFSVNLAGITALIISFISLFRPLRFRFASPTTDIVKAEKILKNYSDSTEDFFKLFPYDKHYFFSSNNQAFLAYKVNRGVALILDGPSGKQSEFRGLLKLFLEFSHNNGWIISIIHANTKTKNFVKSFGFMDIYIGNEAVIDTRKFIEETIRNKYFRYVFNKAQRDNLTFNLYLPPLSPKQLESLSTISESWQSSRNRREFTFLMAPFSTEYLRQSKVAVVLQSGKPVAYANIIPSFLKNSSTIDHMRFIHNSSSQAMPFLLANLIDTLKDQNIYKFNLGFSPLTGYEDRSKYNQIERIIATFKKLFDLLYSASGLERFKTHFDPLWEPKYICYESGISNLFKTAIALNRAVQVPKIMSSSNYPIILAVIASLLNSSWPLAYLFNPQKAFHGLVSDLGMAGEPYAWLFNFSDILSGLIIFYLSILIWKRIIQKNYFYKSSIYAFAISGLATTLAAIYSLPASVLQNTIDYRLLLHNFFSAVSSGGLMLSAIILIIYFWKIREKNISIIIFVIVFTLIGIYAAISYLLGINVDFIQRIFILCNSLWIVLFTMRMNRQRLT